MPLDPKDFDFLRKELKPLIRSRFDKRAQTRVDSSDILMESIERAVNAQGARFEGMTNEERLVYLRKSLVSVAIDVYRRHVLSDKRNVRKEQPIDNCVSTRSGPAYAVARDLLPEETALHSELVRVVEAALALLPTLKQEIFRLKVFEGYTIREAAKQRNITFGKAARYYDDAIRHVRSELERIFGEP